MSVDQDGVLVNDDGGVRQITLNRPDVLNAFNDAMLKSLSKAVRGAEKDKAVRCLVITGAGRAFSSGQDLADVRDRYKSDEPIELGSHLRDHYNPLPRETRSIGSTSQLGDVFCCRYSNLKPRANFPAPQ